ncbi:hypothetical protein O0I10_012918 [Lichtheimia ornata]|uniref:Uncharacterized protein n=1 Tax=Lichtheimia ornata TaxID=688661 RepID=A0AAD7XVD3_9FUNG|nr:uncharacterized protein O0I10_012918 [Lichtheimia ornata]KAJ8651517.1 hypothetical protein O0I10_012918 [Lichtheimia ornata]
MLSTSSSPRSYGKRKPLIPSSTTCANERSSDDGLFAAHDTNSMTKPTPLPPPATHESESTTTKKSLKRHESYSSLDDEALLESVMDEKSTSELLDVFGERLEQEMDAIEDSEAIQQSRSAEHQETCVRAMYMGAASSSDKHLVFSKVAQTLMLCHDYTPCNVFKERKRHIRRLMAGEESDNTIVDAYEDSGLSIIEADFTWSTGRRKQALPYVRQLQGLSNNGLSMVDMKDEEEHEDDEDEFITFAGKKQVDLCFYFFEDRQYNAVVEEDMATLWEIQKLGVPILPLLTSAAISDDDSGVGVVDRRIQLADMLTLYRVQCVEFPMLLDIGPMPSFATQFKDQPLLILSIDQFIALERRTVLGVLHQQSSIPQDKKEPMNECCHHPPHTADNIPSSVPTTPKQHDRKRRFLKHQTVFWLILMISNVLLSLIFRNVALRQEPPKSFASLAMLHDDDNSIIIEIELASSTGAYKTHHNLFACDDGPLATLEIHQGYAKVIPLQGQQGDNTHCSSSSQNTSSSSSSSTTSTETPETDITASRWDKIVQTTQFFLHHYPKLLDIMFTKAHA